MATKTTENSKIITVAPRWKRLNVVIEGTSPLAMQSRPDYIIDNLRRKDNGLPQIKYKNTDWRRFIDSIHWIDNSIKPNTLNDTITEEQYEKQFNEIVETSIKEHKPIFYIPTEAFKESIVTGAYRSGISKDKVSIRGSFIIRGEKSPIEFSKVEMETAPSINRNAKGALVVAVYSKFYDWKTKLSIDYNEDIISAENLINMICQAGLCVGVLARRTELSFGKYGTYTATKAESSQI